MGSPVWFFVATLFFVSVHGKAVDTGAKSPAPQASASSERKLAGMKELVLYLTPDQVEVLEAAGAVVKPFPQFEKAFLQQQQSVEEQPEAQPETQNEEAKQEPELEEFYKVLNVQQIKEKNEDKKESVEQRTEKPRPKNKYTLKTRQQDYAAIYAQKKANRGKTSSAEYVRFLPNYEIENLKMESYRPKPVPGYRFEVLPENLEIAKFLLTEAPEIKKNKENPQKPVEPESSEEETEDEEPQVEAPAESEESESAEEEKGPVTFAAKVRDSAKGKKPVKNENKKQESPKEEEPAPAQEESAEEQQEENEEEEVEVTLTEEELIEKIRSLAKAEAEKPETPVLEIEKQVASLLAPLLKHKQITEAIAKEKEELAKNEQEIQNKLKELKNSGKHDDDQYAEQLRKLNENLERQNALAEKLARQGISKRPEPQVTEEPEEEQEEEQQQPAEEEAAEAPEPTESEEAEKVNDATPVVIRIPDGLDRPQFYPVSLDFLRSLPVAVPKTKKVEELKPLPVEKRLRLPESGNVFFKLNKPYLVQQPDKYTIIRHIWEH